jgi:hypothetical protein
VQIKQSPSPVPENLHVYENFLKYFCLIRNQQQFNNPLQATEPPFRRPPKSPPET